MENLRSLSTDDNENESGNENYYVCRYMRCKEATPFLDCSFPLIVKQFLDGSTPDASDFQEMQLAMLLKDLKRGGQKRQNMADNYIARICGLLDANMLTVHSKCDPINLLQMLSYAILFSSDPEHASLMFSVRVATLKDLRYYHATTDRERLQDGSSMLEEARKTAENLPSCLSVAIMHLTEMYHMTYAFEEHPCPENKRALYEAGEMTLRCFGDEEPWMKVIWARLNITRRILTLLGISHQFQIISGYQPETNDLMKVLDLFDQFENCRKTSPVTVKVEMYYRIAYARKCELCGEFTLAVQYIEDAIDLAKGSCFRYIDNLLEYRNQLVLCSHSRCKTMEVLKISNTVVDSEQTYPKTVYGEDWYRES